MARTRIEIDQDLARRLQALAEQEGQSLEETTDRVLERGLEARGRDSNYRLELEVWETELRPGIDLTDRSTLPDRSRWPPRS